MFAVVVTLRIKPAFRDSFLSLIYENATASRTDEPGCLQFDVATDPSRPEEVFLYEVYRDPAAFEAHLETAHFRSFDASTADMIAEKQIKTFRSVVQ